MATRDPRVEFPLRVSWLETGKVETFDDVDDLFCNLEEFDSDDPSFAAEAEVRDSRGRPVRLKLSIVFGRCHIELWKERGA